MGLLVVSIWTMKMKPTYKIIHQSGPDWTEKVEWKKFHNDQEADAFCDGMWKGGARKAIWKKVKG